MMSRPARRTSYMASPDRNVLTEHGALVVLLGTLALAATAARATTDDPLTGLYGNTLISERTINISPLGGAAHVWLERDGTYISFDVTTGGRSGTYALKRVGA